MNRKKWSKLHRRQAGVKNNKRNGGRIRGRQKHDTKMEERQHHCFLSTLFRVRAPRASVLTFSYRSSASLKIILGQYRELDHERVLVRSFTAHYRLTTQPFVDTRGEPLPISRNKPQIQQTQNSDYPIFGYPIFVFTRDVISSDYPITLFININFYNNRILSAINLAYNSMCYTTHHVHVFTF